MRLRRRSRTAPRTGPSLLTELPLRAIFLVVGFLATIAAVVPPPVLVALGFVPGAFWLWYFYQHDHREPEPLHLVGLAFVAGMASVVAAVVVERAAIQAWNPGELISASVLAPVVEEGLKCLGVILVVWRLREFEDPLDGIVYAAAAGLGFAGLENALYLLKAKAETAPAVVATYQVRALLSVPAHALFSSLWGWPLGYARCCPSRRAARLVGLGLVGSMLAHGTFNLIPGLGGPLLLMFGLVAALWWGVHQQIAAAREHADEAHADRVAERRGQLARERPDT